MHKPDCLRQFESIDAYLRYLEGEPESPWTKGEKHSITGDSYFTGTESWEEAVDLARAGWQEGAEKMVKAFADIQDHLYMRGMVPIPALSFDQPGPLDIGRYAQGRPDCLMVWQDSEEVRWGARGVVSIAINISVSGGVSKDAIFRKGAVAGCLVDALERMGRRVEISIVHAIAEDPMSRDRPGLVQVVQIKRPEDPLDLDRLAFNIAHPSSLRRLGFRADEQAPADIRRRHNVPGNYGYPADYTPPDTDIYIGHSFLGDYGSDTNSAAEWVKQQLIAQGVRIDTED